MQELSLETAQALVREAIDKARHDFGARAVCVAVCDERGLLVAFARMDGAPARSVAIAQGKAYSAARLGTTTAALLARIQREQIAIGYFCDPLLTALPGATPLRDQAGQLLGAIGVSGLTSAEDQALTDAVAATLLAT